jgi:signal transduction histidine kinase
LQEGEEKERKRLAEELHDGIGAKLSGLKMNLEYLRSKAGDQTYDLMFSKLIGEMGESINEIRELSHNLKPAFISAQNLKQALSGVVEKLNTSSNIHCFIEVSIADEPPIEIKLSVYRIVTELLNNIYKHSKADQAFIQVMEENGVLQLLVEDNGVGFDVLTPVTGNGMHNIRSRVEAMLGNLSIDSSPKGTSIIIDIPLNNK